MQNSRAGPTDNIAEARPAVRRSWSSPTGGHPSPGHIANPTSSPTLTTSTPPTPPPRVQPRPAGT